MADSFRFNRTKKNYLIVLKGRELPALAPIEHQLIKVPKRPGSIYSGSSTNIRPISVPVWLNKPEQWTFSQLREDLATWLKTDQPAELRFDDDPARVYFALLENIENLEIINSNTATTTIHFICPDPYKYSDEKTTIMQNGFTNIDNLGNIETYPTVKVKVNKPLTYLQLIRVDDAFLQIGQTKALEQPTYEPYTRVFMDEMSTTLGWTQAGYVDNGYIGGEIKSNGYALYPDTYGTVIQPPKWQGPSIKKSIGTSVTDFYMDVRVELWNKGGKTGMLEVYLLNAASETVAKIGIEDRWEDTDRVVAKCRLGSEQYGHWLMSSVRADQDRYWDNFVGVLKIERNKNKWAAYLSPIDPKTGVHTRPKGTNRSVNFYDASGRFDDPITQVQIAFRKFPDSQEASMNVQDIRIYRINDKPLPQAIPMVAMPGDELEFDHYKNTVRRNGQLVQGLKDFGSSFFPLKPGRNRLELAPYDAGQVTIKHRERYL